MAWTCVFVPLEVSARLWLQHLASPDQFAAYASLHQLAARPETHKLAPHRHLGFVTTPHYQRGRNRHNAFGLRGDEVATPKPKGVFRVVCMGGSTTYGSPVEDPADAYPALLQDALRQAGRHHVEVLNAGVPGYGSLESLIALQLRVLDLEPDLILVSHAVNDVNARLIWPPSPEASPARPALVTSRFAEMPSLLEHSTLIRGIQVRLGWIASHGSLERALAPSPSGELTRLLHRQAADGTYPEGIFRDVALAEILRRNPPVAFERNLFDLAVLARAHDVRPVLVTFPYHPRWAGPSPISVPAYRDAIEESNRVTLRVAEASGASGFDLAVLVPPEDRYYVDGYHFTREGNELRARLLAAMLLERELLSRPSGGLEIDGSIPEHGDDGPDAIGW